MKLLNKTFEIFKSEKIRNLIILTILFEIVGMLILGVFGKAIIG